MEREKKKRKSRHARRRKVGYIIHIPAVPGRHDYRGHHLRRSGTVAPPGIDALLTVTEHRLVQGEGQLAVETRRSAPRFHVEQARPANVVRARQPVHRLPFGCVIVASTSRYRLDHSRRSGGGGRRCDRSTAGAPSHAAARQ